VQTRAQTLEDFSGREMHNNQVDAALEPDWNGEVHVGYIPGRTAEI
jgi:hypothetical protein